MDKINATDARRDFFKIVKGVAEKHQIYRVQHGKGNVVILSEDEYESLTESLELLSIPGFRESMARSVEQMQKGDTVSFEEVFGED